MNAGAQELRALDALGMAAQIKCGDISPIELVDAAIDAIEANDVRINAVVHRDFERARKIAREPPKGVFGGVPFLVKDLNTEVASLPASKGSAILRNAIAADDSEIVRRYRAAGLIVLGMTNSPEFGLSVSTEPVAFGVTRNPLSLDLSPGGSSGGSAAAVAAGFVPAAHATDSSGSIRIPASFCGLVGLKPSRGRTPLLPAMAGDPEVIATSHAVTRSVRDSAALLDAVSQPFSFTADPPRHQPGGFLAAIRKPPPRLRCAMVSLDRSGVRFDASCQAAMEECGRRLAAHDVDVESVECPIHLPDLWNPMLVTLAGRMAQTVEAAWRIGDRQAEPEPVAAELAARGTALPAAEIADARMTASRLARHFLQLLERFDLVLTPSCGRERLQHGWLDTSFAMDTFYARMMSIAGFCPSYNIAGLPAISLPIHLTPHGLPVGAMLGAGFGREAILLQVAARLETESPWCDGKAPASRSRNPVEGLLK